MKIEDFKIMPDLGAPTCEPPLEDIIFQYFHPHFGTEKASDLTDRYIAKLIEDSDAATG